VQSGSAVAPPGVSDEFCPLAASLVGNQERENTKTPSR
jgi:hypothetical protein